MEWDKNKFETFFGTELIPCGATDLNSVLSARFESQGLEYELTIDKQAGMFGLNVHNRVLGFPFPTFEISFKCKKIDFTEAQGVGPVMLFYHANSLNPEAVNLCITKSQKNNFSVSVGFNE